MITVNLDRKRLLTASIFVVLVTLVAVEAYMPGFAGSAKTSSNNPSVRGLGSSNGTITVSGTGHSDVTPDRAILTIGVVSQAATAEAAVTNNSNTMNAVLSALNGLGIGNSNIQTIYYYIYPQTSCCSGPQTITGYQVTNEIQVTVVMSGQTLSQLGIKTGRVIDTAVSNGATQIYGIQFTTSADVLTQARQSALTLAVQDASQQVHVLASALGVTITGVDSVTTVPSYYGPVYPVGASAGGTTPVVPPQSVSVTASVQVVFAIS